MLLDFNSYKVFGCAAHVYLPKNVYVNKMAPWSELMTFLSYKPGIKSYKFVWLTNTVFIIASMTSFDKHLFPCCPEAKMPPMTRLGDKPPSGHKDSHGTPRDEDDNHPSGPSSGHKYSDDHSTPQGPPSPGPSNTDSTKDESDGDLDDMYGLDVPSDQTACDNAVNDPPRITAWWRNQHSPTLLSREPSVPQMPVQPSDFIPNEGDQNEWNQILHQSGRSRNIPNYPGNIYGKQCLPPDIERDLIWNQY